MLQARSDVFDAEWLLLATPPTTMDDYRRTVVSVHRNSDAVQAELAWRGGRQLPCGATDYRDGEAQFVEEHSTGSAVYLGAGACGP